MTCGPLFPAVLPVGLCLRAMPRSFGCRRFPPRRIGPFPIRIRVRCARPLEVLSVPPAVDERGVVEHDDAGLVVGDGRRGPVLVLVAERCVGGFHVVGYVCHALVQYVVHAALAHPREVAVVVDQEERGFGVAQLHAGQVSQYVEPLSRRGKVPARRRGGRGHLDLEVGRGLDGAVVARLVVGLALRADRHVVLVSFQVVVDQRIGLVLLAFALLEVVPQLRKTDFGFVAAAVVVRRHVPVEEVGDLTGRPRGDDQTVGLDALGAQRLLLGFAHACHIGREYDADHVGVRDRRGIRLPVEQRTVGKVEVTDLCVVGELVAGEYRHGAAGAELLDLDPDVDRTGCDGRYQTRLVDRGDGFVVAGPKDGIVVRLLGLHGQGELRRLRGKHRYGRRCERDAFELHGFRVVGAGDCRHRCEGGSAERVINVS